MKKITFYADDEIVKELAELEKLLGVKTTTAALRHIVRRYRKDTQLITELRERISSMRTKMTDIYNALNARKQADQALNECSKKISEEIQ